MIDFTILPDPPPYRETEHYFGGFGGSEGMVVEFVDANGGQWIGKFGREWSTFDGVYPQLGDDFVVIIASGAGYVIDAARRSLVHRFEQCVHWACYVKSIDALIVSNGFGFEAFNKGGTVWRTPRISWDGMRNIVQDGDHASGEAYSPIDRAWHPFEIDLQTGGFEGGSYDGPPMPWDG